MRARLKRSFNQFIDVNTRSDIEVAILLKSLEVDIAVDLMGYTAVHVLRFLRNVPRQFS